MDIHDYTASMIKWMDEINHVKTNEEAAVVAEKCVDLNMKMLDELNPSKDLAPEEFNTFVGTTIEMIDHIISLYEKIDRPVQIYNFNLLKKDLQERLTGGVIRVVS